MESPAQDELCAQLRSSKSPGTLESPTVVEVDARDEELRDAFKQACRFVSPDDEADKLRLDVTMAKEDWRWLAGSPARKEP